jgi:hypothetical protein
MVKRLFLSIAAALATWGALYYLLAFIGFYIWYDRFPMIYAVALIALPPAVAFKVGWKIFRG